MRTPGRLFWPLAAATILADCSSKRAVEAALPLAGVPRDVVRGLLRFKLHYNPGAAFSTNFGPYQRWVLVGVAVGVLAVLWRSYGSIARTGWLGVTGLALVVGGAAGNLLDRLISDRGVVDFIDVGVGASRFFIFNVADAGVSVGAALLIIATWRNERQRLADTGLRV